MTNVSSINHANFAKLHDLTNNYNKATLLDKLIFWWQISSYTLDDEKIWFTRSLSQIAEESKIPKRSVERYLHDFEAAGFIEKTNKLYKKKNLYIRITEKLLILLRTPSDVKIQKDNVLSNKAETIEAPNTTGGLFFHQFGATDSAKLAVSIYKDQDNNFLNNSTVSQTCNVDNLNNSPKPNPDSTYPNYPIEKVIGEQVTEQFKNYIKGTMRNLQSQHKLIFSNPEQLFAEIIFSVLHVENQFPGVLDNHHRVNLIAKLLRNKQWRTPKGFYNHWDVGQLYKSKLEKQEQAKPHRKQDASSAYDEGCEASNIIDYRVSLHNVKPAVKNYQLQSKIKPLKFEHREVLAEITTEKKYLADMENRFLQKADLMTKQLVENTAIKIAKLYERLELLNQQIQNYQEAA